MLLQPSVNVNHNIRSVGAPSAAPPAPPPSGPSAPTAPPAHLDDGDILRDYLARGWCVKPCHGVHLFHVVSPPLFRCTCRRGSDCGKNAGKHPHGKWRDVKKPPSMRGIEELLYGDGLNAPDPVNWAILLGPTQLVVMDVDPRNGGLEGLAALEAKYGPLPRTAQDQSGGGGRHYYFAAPAAGVLPRCTSIKLAEGVELLSGYPALGEPGQPGYAEGHNHVVIVAPSVHQSGRPYRWTVPPWELAPVCATAMVHRPGLVD